MKNTIFVISAVIVPLLLISLNYTPIHDYYAYFVPLNSLVIEHEVFTDDPNIFQKTFEKEDSQCFTTPSKNFFCYEKPRMYENEKSGESHVRSGISYVRSSTGIDGELHFNPIDSGVFYFTIKNMTRIHNDTSLITLADKDYSISKIDGSIYSINEEFEYTTTIEKFDTFISHCRNYEGTIVTIVQYLGITTIDDVDFFMTWHVPAKSEQGVKCDYPEIMQYSLEYDFGI